MNNSQHPNGNVPQPVATEQNNPNWRQTDLTVQERAKLVSQLGQALKHLSPSTQETQIINVARAFEGQIFGRSSSKREYLTLYSRKFSQIQRQLVIQANQQNQAGLGVTTAGGLAGLVADNNGGPSNLLGVNIQQQMQALTNSPQQQSIIRPPQQQQLQQQQQGAGMQQQAQLRPQMIAAGQQQQQRPLTNQQVMARQLLNVKSLQQLQQRQAMVAAASGGGQGPQQQAAQLQAQYQQAVATLQNLNQSGQLTGTLTQGQLQSLIQRQQIVAQQQQHQAVAAQNASNAPQNPANFLVNRPAAPQPAMRPQISLGGVDTSSAINSPAMTAGTPISTAATSVGPSLAGAAGASSPAQQRMAMAHHQQLQMQQQTQQQQQAQITQLQAQQAQQQDPSSIGLHTQQGQQGSAVRPPHAGVSHSQHGAAVQAVHGMDKNIVASRVKTNPIEGLSEEEKAAIREQVKQMTEMFKRVDQLLPVFLALTSNHEATKRLMLMKYMFQDQLDALPRGEYVISLANLKKLKEQFSRYFLWVKNQIGGQSQPLPGASPPDTNAQTTAVPAASQTVLQQQAMAAQQRVHELRQQQQQQSVGPQTTQMAMKHVPLDLKLPPAKKQAKGQSPPSTTISATMTLPQQRSQESVAPGDNSTPISGTGVPVTVDLTGSPVPASVQPLQPAQSAAQVRPLFSGLSQQQAVQAAIAAGLAPQIAHALSPRALQAQHLLQQANLGKTLLNPAQKAQLQKMYSDQVVIARQVAQQQTNAKALAAAAQMQQTSASGATFAGVVPTPAVGATGNNPKLQQTTSITAPTPMQVAVDAVEQNKAQIQAMAAAQSAAVQQQQLQARQQQQQQQQTTTVAIKIEPVEVSTKPTVALVAKQQEIQIKQEPLPVIPNSTVAPPKAEPVFVMREPRPGVGHDGAVFDTALYTDAVLKDFTELKLDKPDKLDENQDSKSDDKLKASGMILFSPFAPVLGPSRGKGFVGEDHVFGQASPKKQPEVASIKDVLRGFAMGKDDDTDWEEDMIDMDEIDADDEQDHSGKSRRSSLGDEGEAVRKSISKLGNDWVVASS
ncbi:mediator complex subunit 15-domain-containing protein [Jimgerdemannia flammicorona]|uniref:Mediator complex subunit 15-domain-containing protein n=2 Tax=Jimgerdemannia flammicorona TaxID=994334 RepID=A0A433Q7A2_9FUNG|nr:mediator complex subunit 15-domain-containing protein [Jimgerdemannia flammicorona]RUS25664.1 mediator complex subunit 15-domain-containing protein [Jimgerdemannia flammicorona]